MARHSVCDQEGCSASFDTAKALRQHKLSEHPELFPFVCEENGCEFRAETWKSLHGHELSAHGVTKFPCEFHGGMKNSYVSSRWGRCSHFLIADLAGESTNQSHQTCRLSWMPCVVVSYCRQRPKYQIHSESSTKPWYMADQ